MTISKVVIYGMKEVTHNMANFKNLTNGTKSAMKQTSNRPQGAIKQTRNGGAASFKLKQSKSGVSTSHLNGAIKSNATLPAGGGKFGSFIGQ